MEKDQILKELTKHICEVLPAQRASSIKQTDTLIALGANSLESVEVLIKCASALNLNIPLEEFSPDKNIEEIVSLFAKYS